MNLTIRPANLPQEYPAIAAVLKSESPGWAMTAEELAYNFNAKAQRRRVTRRIWA
jgi:hypothetical protein